MSDLELHEALQDVTRILIDRIVELAETLEGARAELAEAEEHAEELEHRLEMARAGFDEEDLEEAREVVRDVVEELGPPATLLPDDITVGESVPILKLEPDPNAGTYTVTGVDRDAFVPRLQYVEARQDSELLKDQLAASQQRCRELERALTRERVRAGRPVVTSSRMPCPECSSPMTYREPGGWSCDACEQLAAADGDARAGEAG